MEIAPDPALFFQPTESAPGPTVTVKRRRIAAIPPLGEDAGGDAPAANLPSVKTPKVYRLPGHQPPVEADPVLAQSPQRRQRRDPIRKAVVLRHVVFTTTSTQPPQVEDKLAKYQLALDALAAIERDLCVVASCREFLRSFPAGSPT